MLFYALTALANAATSTFLGVFVYFKNKKAKVNQTFVLPCLSVAVWSYSYFFFQLSTIRETTLFWSRALMVGAIFIPICYLHFVLVLINKVRENKKLLVFGYLIFFFFFLVNFTPLFVEGVVPKLDFNFWPNPGPLYHPFLLLWFFYAFYSIYLLLKESSISTGIQRSQLRYILIGTIVGYLGGATNYLLWYDIPVPPIGNWTATFYVGIAAYAIVRYRLMDIRVVLGHSAIYLLSFITVILLAFSLMYLNVQLAQPLTFNTVLLLGAFSSLLFFQTVKLYERIAGKYFYHALYNTQIVITDLEERLTQVLELETLSSLIVNTLNNTLKLERIGIITKEIGKETYTVQKTINFSENDLLLQIKDGFLLQHLQKTKQPIVREELTPLIEKLKPEEKPQAKEKLKQLQDNLKKAKISLCLPLIFEEKLIGIIFIGDKVSEDAFSSQDIEMLIILSHSASIALKNASLYSEVKNRKEELERFYRLTVGRELKMVELKKKILELEEKIKKEKS